MPICDVCKKKVCRVTIRQGEDEWVCHECRTPINRDWTHKRLLESRARMPDGTVLQGFAGERIMSDRLRFQDSLRKKGEL